MRDRTDHQLTLADYKCDTRVIVRYKDKQKAIELVKKYSYN